MDAIYEIMFLNQVWVNTKMNTNVFLKESRNKEALSH